MSAADVPIPVSNKMLPGDKTGLPWEIWQMILSCLSASDLCRVACVCKTWSDLVISLDSTRWRQLYQACSEWRHPFWPLNTHAEPPSWRLAYRDQYISTKFWRHKQKQELSQFSCTAIFRKSITQRNIHVGPGMGHDSLNTALSSANPYDRIVIHPGIYDEQFEVAAKIPFEMVGYGELGSVILVVGIQQLTTSTRLSNLVLRAPWFTSFIVMVNTGYLQIDNCIIENGMICAQNPSTVHIKFCTFRHATVILQNMNTSIIENCEFSQSDSANIIIEGYPKDFKNWSYSYLKERSNAIYQQNRSLHRKKHILKASNSMTSTIRSSFTAKSMTTVQSGQLCDSISHDQSCSFDEPGASFLNPSLLGPKYLGSEKDSSVGCGDLQSLYQDSASTEQINLHPSAVSLSKHPQDSKENNSPDNLAKTPSGNLSSNEETKESQQLSQNGLSEKSPANDVVPLVHKQSSLKRNDRRKSVDSRVGFQVDEKSKVHIQGLLDSVQYSVSADANNSNNYTPAKEVKSKTVQKAANQNKPSCPDVSNSNAVLHVVPYTVSQLPLVSVCEHENNSPQSQVDSLGLGSSPHQNLAIDRSQPVSDDVQNQNNNCNKMLVDGSQTVKLEHINSHHSELKCSQDISPGTSGSNTTLTGLSGSHHISQNSSDSHAKSGPSGSHSSQTGPSGSHSTIAGPSVSHILQEPSASHIHAGPSGSHCTPTGPSGSNLTPQDPSASPIHAGPSGSNLTPQDPSGSPIHAGPSGSHQMEAGPSNVGCASANQHAGDKKSPTKPPIRRSQSDEVLLESDEDLSSLNDFEDSVVGSIEDANDGHNALSSSGSDSSDTESRNYTNSEENFSSGEESVIMLPHLQEIHLDHPDMVMSPRIDHPGLMTSPRGLKAEIESINSECTRPVPVNVSEDSLMSSYVGQIEGCLIHQCRMNHSKGGVVVSLQAHAIVSECDISNVGYGIRCIQNARVVILKNKIHHCRTSGIFMRLAASGLVAGNDIHSTNEAGIDIRKSADPLVQYNQIHHGKRSGVVVLGSGRGHIKKNDIFSNAEAGVYILFGGNPTVSENYIYDGRAAGVAINAGGRGCVIDNVIRGNKWGGVDIRNGSCPLVSGNTIINGLSDGIVVGAGGKGMIENNFISGNVGCGLWLLSAKHLYIHGNQICNSGHCGIMLVDMSTISMDQERLMLDLSNKTYSHYDDNCPFPEPEGEFAVIQYNNIYHNKGQGVLIQIDEEVKLLHNAIHGNQKDGILMSHAAPVVVIGNSVTSNGRNGIVTSTVDQIAVSGNGIYGNLQHGVICRNQCVMEDNDIVGQALCSVVVQSGADLQLIGNRLCSSHSPAVKGEESSVIVAKSNKVYDRGGGDFSSDGQLTLTDNSTISPLNGSKKQSKNDVMKTDFLTVPKPRPHITTPPPFTIIPSHTSAMATKVASRHFCDHRSKLCSIL